MERMAERNPQRNGAQPTTRRKRRTNVFRLGCVPVEREGCVGVSAKGDGSLGKTITQP